jgi:thiol-disulfide isomerase/thioredoxin
MHASNRFIRALLGASAILVAAPSAASAQEPAAAPVVAAPADPLAGMELPPPAQKPGWLGVGLRTLNGEEADKVGVKGPVAQVKHVFRGSPAEKAGVARGDLVLEVGGVRLTAGTPEMIARVKSNELGSTVGLLVRRGDEELRYDIELAAVPDRKSMIEDEWMNQAIPDLPLTDLTTGNAITLSSFRGKVLLLDVWATWCGPCKRAMPLVEELQKQYALRGLQVIGVSDEDRPVLEKFVAERPVGYQLAHDPDGSMSSVLFVSSLPTFLVVDREGLVRHVLYGTPGAKELEAAIKPLLAPVAQK